MQTSLMTPKCQTSGKSKICSVKFWTTPLHYTICLLKRRKTSNSLRQTLRSHFTLLYQELMGHVWPVNTFISINVGVNLWLQEKKKEINFHWLRMHFRKCSQLQLIRGAFGNFIDSSGRHFFLFFPTLILAYPSSLSFLVAFRMAAEINGPLGCAFIKKMPALWANTEYSALKSNP